MPAHAERGSTQIFLATDEALRAADVWRWQRALQATDDRAVAERVRAAQARLGGRVFRVPDAQLGELTRRVERLDRRARKLGTGPIRLLDTGERDATASFVVLSGQAPRLAGWTVAAIVSHRDRPSILRPVGTAGEGLAAARFAEPCCEHCGLRRRRAETFVVVRQTTGEVRQVGSGCVRDFVGGHDPERACRQAEYLSLARRAVSDSEQRGRRASAPDPVPATTQDKKSIDRFAVHAARAIRAHGWVSREQARRDGREASADRALRLMRDEPDAPGPGDRALAAGALRWARMLWPTRPSLTAFEREVLAALGDDAHLGARERGLVSALLAIYRRRRARSRPFAEIGARVTVIVLVERTTAQASQRHRALCRHDLLDADANRLVWWQTAGAPLAEGRVVRLDARVRRHTTFAGRPVTVLSHCRVAGENSVDVVETSPPAAGTW
jgi:hypothetical protein